MLGIYACIDVSCIRLGGQRLLLFLEIDLGGMLDAGAAELLLQTNVSRGGGQVQGEDDCHQGQCWLRPP